MQLNNPQGSAAYSLQPTSYKKAGGGLIAWRRHFTQATLNKPYCVHIKTLTLKRVRYVGF